MKSIIAGLFLVMLAASGVEKGRAQESNRDGTPEARAVMPVFRAELPGGTYMVALKSVVSVSKHEYVVDAAAGVQEVNIETTGSLLARFYYIEPHTPVPAAVPGAATAVGKAQQLLTEAADKTGVDAWRRVVKNYPASTHARTVEYRLQTRADIERIYSSAEQAFSRQQSVTVRIQ